MKQLAVPSDTHGLLRSEVEVTKIISGCDAIIHGGDINQFLPIDRFCLSLDLLGKNESD